MKEETRKEFKKKMADYRQPAPEVSWDVLEKALAQNRKEPTVPLWPKRIAAAAAVLLVAGLGWQALRLADKSALSPEALEEIAQVDERLEQPSDKAEELEVEVAPEAGTLAENEGETLEGSAEGGNAVGRKIAGGDAGKVASGNAGNFASGKSGRKNLAFGNTAGRTQTGRNLAGKTGAGNTTSGNAGGNTTGNLVSGKTTGGKTLVAGNSLAAGKTLAAAGKTLASGKASEGVSGKPIEGTSGKPVEGASGKPVEGVSGKNVEGNSGKPSGAVSVETSKKNPETSGKNPVNASGKNPAETSGKNPVKASEKNPVNVSEKSPKQQNAGASKNQGKPASKGTPVRKTQTARPVIYPSGKQMKGGKLMAKVYFSNTVVGGQKGQGGGDLASATPAHTVMSEPVGTGGATDIYYFPQASFKAVNDVPLPKEEEIHHRQPVRVGMTVRYPISDRWSVESGLQYSRLSSDITVSSVGNGSQTDQDLDYLGVPVNVNYQLVGGKRWSVYASAGGAVEKMVKGKRTTRDVANGKEGPVERESVSIKPLQYSVTGAIGAEYHVDSTISIYAEPGMSYHFDNHSAIPTYYQEKPLGLSLNVGLRFNLGK